VLVTGGSGFIGGRLIGRLATECGAKVRVLVRSFGGAARIARYPIEMVRGDITVVEAVDRAAAGCDVIFHCAYGRDGDRAARTRATVSGTDNVLAAARRQGTRRVVYTSTLAVYGTPTTPELDETAPRERTGDLYGDSKLDAEALAFQYWRTHGVPVSVVQPTVVYGPFGPTFTVTPLQQLRTGRIILINGGTGVCNAVYVDDVVSAMLLAAVRQEAIGEAFLISGPSPVTWAEFFGAYERMLGVQATVSLSVDEAMAHYHASQRGSPSLVTEGVRLLRTPEFRARLTATREGALIARLARAVLPSTVRQRVTGRGAARATPIHPIRPARIRLFAAPTTVRADKARDLLGYSPAHDLNTGMVRTRSWAAWANLLEG
jgi:nucleoside-diphosphate-sugar epimerase